MGIRFAKLIINTYTTHTCDESISMHPAMRLSTMTFHNSTTSNTGNNIDSQNSSSGQLKDISISLQAIRRLYIICQAWSSLLLRSWRFKITIQIINSISMFFRYLVALVDDRCILDVFLLHVLVTPAPDGIIVWMFNGLDFAYSRTVACPGCSLLDHLNRDSFKIVRPTDLCKHINESCCEVSFVVTKLRCLVVPGEDVVVIVPALAERSDGNAKIVSWTNRTAIQSYINKFFFYFFFLLLKLSILI